MNSEKVCLNWYDDGKEKWQSHEVTITDTDLFEISVTSDTHGYGETKEEAIQDLKQKLHEFLLELDAVEEKLDNGLVDIIEVDCLGHPLSTK